MPRTVPTLAANPSHGSCRPRGARNCDWAYVCLSERSLRAFGKAASLTAAASRPVDHRGAPQRVKPPQRAETGGDAHENVVLGWSAKTFMIWAGSVDHRRLSRGRGGPYRETFARSPQNLLIPASHHLDPALDRRLRA